MARVNNFVENGGRLCRTLARSVSVDVDPNARKKISRFFSGGYPGFSHAARENRISTQGAVRKWLGKIKCLCGVCLVCDRASEEQVG